MPNNAKTDSEWKRDMTAFARSGEECFPRGYHPRCEKWKGELDKILNCPKHLNMRPVSDFFRKGPKKALACDCTYHVGYKPKVPEPVIPPVLRPQAVRTNNGRIVPGASLALNRRPEPPPPPPAPKVFSKGNKLPGLPNFLKVEDVRGKICWMPKKSKCLDLFVFGPMTGRCPHCDSSDIRAHDVCTRLKMVWNYGLPYYALGLDIACNNPDCRRKIKSIDHRYVRTLPRKDRLAMPFIQVGHTTGIDFKMIRMMRIGQLADNVVQGALSMMNVEYQQLRSTYVSRAKKAVSVLGFDSYAPFEELPNTWKPKGHQLIQSFICDYYVHKPDLLRELQSIKSKQSLAVDHQRQVVKRVKQGELKEEEIGTQSFTVCGDYGLVLNYVVVPNTADEWGDECLDEVVLRHGEECPEVLFVDCNCCNGNIGDSSSKNPPPEPGEDGYRLWKTKLIKKLDGFHVCMRASRAVNPAHPRMSLFSKHFAKAIYVRDTEIEAKLQDLRERHNLDLTENQIRNDWSTYGRSCPGAGADVATRILDVIDTHRTLDHEAQLSAIAAGEDLEDIGPEHYAYPLMTKKVHKTCIQQAVHALNGCMDCEGKLSHAILKTQEYRNTGERLPIFRSPFGTSRCETLHSVQARIFRAVNGLRQAYFDARTHWKVTHMNRGKLHQLGVDVPPHGVAPVEYEDTKLHTNSDLNLPLFGFDYCKRVLADKDDEYYFNAVMSLDEFDVDLEKDGEKKKEFDDLDNMLEADSNELTIVGQLEDKDDEYTRKWSNSSKSGSTSSGVQELRQKLNSLLLVSRASTSPRRIARAKRKLDDLVPEPVAFDLTEDVVNHQIGLTEQVGQRKKSMTDVDRRRNVYLRRATKGDLTYYKPNHNEQMETVWIGLFAKANATERSYDGKIVEEILTEYTKIEVAERLKGPEARPLLPVSRAYATIWVKKTHLARNKPTKEGRTSTTAIGLVEGVQGRLANANRGMNPVAAANVTDVVMPGCEKLPDKVANEVKVHRKAQKTCRTCGMPLGAGPGQHKRGHCPQMTDEAKQQQKEAAEDRKNSAAEYKRELNQRIMIARNNIKHNLKPELQRTKERKTRAMDLPGQCSYCPVCSYDYNKNLEPTDVNWHFTRRKRMLYCPWADPPDVKQELLKSVRASRDKYNERRRILREKGTEELNKNA